VKLIDLRPEFIRSMNDYSWICISDTIISDRVSGIKFKCPKCFLELGDLDKTHYIFLWRPNAPQGLTHKFGRFEFSNKWIQTLTLSAPIYLSSRCRASFVLENGEITFI